MGIQTAMDAVVAAPGIVAAMRLADDVAFEASRNPGSRTLRHLATAIDGEDAVLAIAAVHALAGMADGRARDALAALLSDDRGFVAEHAAWALRRTPPRTEAIARLIGMVTAGGFTGMQAQQTLESWSDAAGETIAVALETSLLSERRPDRRARLIETLGLVPGPCAARHLLEVAVDRGESPPVRAAAVAALGRGGDDRHVASTLTTLAAGTGEIADLARLALVDLQPTPAPGPRGGGALTVAQLFLHADIDPALASAGAGDNGGIATLLVHLGDALVGDPSSSIARALTISRGTLADTSADLRAVASEADGHVYARIPLGPSPVPSASAWPLRVAARRGVRRMLRAAGRVDVVHLRMADVGSLAAADAARELGIPTVFTVAPDPHAHIDARDRAGGLSRRDFGAADLREHLWFRASLVRSLAASAEHTVLFPRPSLAEDMRTLVGIDIASHPERHTVVAEGIDLARIDRAVAETKRAPTAASAELTRLLATLAPDRRRLPLIATVGRLHRVKGMATLVETWASTDLSERANLLVIGGDLASPSPEESHQLSRIDRVVPPATRPGRGLVIAGHRPNDVAVRWLAAARLGVPGFAAPDGVYVCASEKEEFGIAVLEAMAAGLVVVAPDEGGPATYVAHGDTGFLTRTSDPAHLAIGIRDALDRAASGDARVAERARGIVARRFTVQAMAATLATAYRDATASDASRPGAVGIAS